MSKKQQHVTGKVKRSPDGFGFLIPIDPEEVDIYLPRHTMKGIMTDDLVVATKQRERDGRFSGEIVKILKRGHTTTVGKFKKAVIGGGGVVLDDSKAWGENLIIPPDLTAGAQNNDMVHVKIDQFPGEGPSHPGDLDGFVGHVLEVLGASGDPKIDTKKIIYEKKIPYEFSQETLRQVEKIPDEVTPQDWQGRADLRDKKFVTIDGATARDFDDAVYAEKEKNGYRVWVAIADVSHYVKPGTALDRDAYERGTSVYFPDMVVPMLPEKLSNGLCSLNPLVPRLAMVAEVELNHQGHINHYSIYDAVFMSHRRFTYGEVQEVLDGKTESEFQHLGLMRDIAQVLMKKRFSEGSLDLEIPESQLVLDAQGEPIDVSKSERIFAHRLIEEFMLLANIVVAKFISEKNVPTLYRIHEDPFADALKNLELIAHNWGVKARLSSQGRSGETQKNLMKMLAAVKGKPEEIILSILTLRSMKQAQYHQENKGHFGLAFDHYTHFTSPIRRYPDLIVHRTLKQILKGDKLRETEKDELFEKMTQMGIHLSGCEQRATQAERDLMSVKRCRFMEKRLGQVFAGLVTGIHKFGFFVQLREYDIDGLVSVQSLDFDYFTYNEAAQKLIGKKTKTVVSLGDVVEVKVVRADYNKRQIDFEWVNHKNANANPEKRSQTPPDRQRHGQTRLSQPHGKSHPGKVHSKKNNKRRGRRKAKRS